MFNLKSSCLSRDWLSDCATYTLCSRNRWTRESPCRMRSSGGFSKRAEESAWRGREGETSSRIVITSGWHRLGLREAQDRFTESDRGRCGKEQNNQAMNCTSSVTMPENVRRYSTVLWSIHMYRVVLFRDLLQLLRSFPASLQEVVEVSTMRTSRSQLLSLIVCELEGGLNSRVSTFTRPVDAPKFPGAAHSPEQRGLLAIETQRADRQSDGRTIRFTCCKTTPSLSHAPCPMPFAHCPTLMGLRFPWMDLQPPAFSPI